MKEIKSLFYQEKTSLVHFSYFSFTGCCLLRGMWKNINDNFLYNIAFYFKKNSNFKDFPKDDEITCSKKYFDANTLIYSL